MQTQGTKKRETVSLCMIVRDEAGTLQKAIESVLPVVDEIVIGVDDRTADDSEAIARKFTDKVYRFKWRNDFSAARNEMLSHCTCTWILILDGHETLRKSCLPLFRKVLCMLPGATEAVGMTLKLQAEDRNFAGIQLRLLRNNGRIRYEGEVHNVVVCVPESTLGFAEIVIDHVRPASNRESREKQRNQMVPRKMEEVLAGDSHHSKALYYAGIHAHERKDYRQAVEYYRRYLDCSDHPEERYKVIWHLGGALFANGDRAQAREAFHQGVRERWDLPECYVALGDMAIREEEWDKAEHYFKLACDCNQPLSGIFFSHDFYTWLPYHKLCEVYDKAGRHYEAILAGEKLLEFENLPEAHRKEIESFMPLWAEKVISSHPVRSGDRDKRNFLIVDKGGGFTSDLAEHFRKSWNVEVISAFLPQYLNWADVAWFDWCDENAVAASQASWDCRVICTLRSYEYFTDYPRQVNWDNVDQLVFVAEHVRRLSLEKFPGMREERTSVIPDGIDLDRFTFRERGPGKDIAWVGFLNPKKNVPLLLEIASQLPGYRFHIAGSFQDDRLRLYWEHYVEESRLKNVEFYGWVDDINAFLDDKNFILSTSLWEGTQVAVLEAMAKGIKPLVHSWIGAEDICGPDCVYRNTSELRQRLKKGDYRSRGYRRRIEKHFSLQGRLARIEELINAAVPARKPRNLRTG